MEKSTIKLFLNKKVKLFLLNGYHYSGIILKIGNNSLVLDDRYDGMMVLDYDKIKNFKEVKDGEEE